MAEKVRCEICDRTFKDAAGLKQHNAAKHASASSEKKSVNVDTKKIKNWAIFIVVIGIVAGFVVWSVMGAISESRSCKTAPVTEIDIGGHTNLKLHIHANLKILIDGKEQLVPTNVGISQGVMRPLHTHDTNGEIHMEGPCARDFTLGEFFQIWGREFSSQCIFDKCTNVGELKFFVNGVPNNEFENYVLRDGDAVRIEFSSFE